MYMIARGESLQHGIVKVTHLAAEVEVYVHRDRLPALAVRCLFLVGAVPLHVAAQQAQRDALWGRRLLVHGGAS